MHKRYLPLISAGISIFSAFFFSAYPLGGVTQKDISDKYMNTLTPASFTFSIWGLIYISWIFVAILIYKKGIKISKKESLFFSLSMLLSSLWLIPWHYDMIGTSLIIMYLLLGCLLHLFQISRDTSKLFRIPIDLFLAWILVASLANLSVFFTSIGVTLPDTFAVFSLTGLSIVAFFFINSYKAYIPIYVVFWALVGIYSNTNNPVLHFLIYSLLLVSFLFLVKRKLD